MVAVGVAPVTVTDALPVALIVGVLTLTVTGELGQPCDGEPEPLGQGVGLVLALALAEGDALADGEVLAVGVADGLAELPGSGGRPPMIDSIGFGCALGLAQGS